MEGYVAVFLCIALLFLCAVCVFFLPYLMCLALGLPDEDDAIFPPFSRTSTWKKWFAVFVEVGPPHVSWFKRYALFSFYEWRIVRHEDHESGPRDLERRRIGSNTAVKHPYDAFEKVMMK